MEELDNEKYSKLENLENLFKSIDHFGEEYNYCFSCFIPPSLLPTAFGLIGGLIAKIKNKNITGYMVNKNEKEICLIPLIVNDDDIIRIDTSNHIEIKPEDIKNIKIKTEDFKYKRIIITLNDKTKYKMMTAKKIKEANYHEPNLNNFINSCSKK